LAQGTHIVIYNNVLLTVKEEADVPRIKELLTEQCRLSREEPGCVRFEVYQSQTERRFFLLVEQWESTAALDQHRLAKAYLEIYKPHVIPFVDRTPHPCDLVM